MQNCLESYFFDDKFIYSKHPNPAWARKKWFSLDGIWNLEHKNKNKKIKVPYPIGSSESGVEFKDKGSFIYSRLFDLKKINNHRYLLYIGASDYNTIVYINGEIVGQHIGGYSSFSMDISENIRNGSNEIKIKIRDSHSPFQVRGKQTFLRKPFLVWYKGISGIWQNVWIEECGENYIAKSNINYDFKKKIINGYVELGPSIKRKINEEEEEKYYKKIKLEIEITGPDGSKRIFKAFPCVEDKVLNFKILFDDIYAKVWSADEPNLYAIQYRLYNEDIVEDQVESYLGLRDIEIDNKGFKINGKRIYLRMVLVQGYYPEGIYAPKNMKIIADDIKAIKEMGFNGARIHQKVESPYFQYLCDRLGLYTSFEMPSFYLASKKAFIAYRNEITELIQRDIIHPTCIFRILFNETWGIWRIYNKKSNTRRFILDIIKLVKKIDPSRPIIDNSGWEHIETDIVDFHHYLKTPALALNAYEKIKNNDPKILYGVSILKVIIFYLYNKISTTTRALFIEKKDYEKCSKAPLLISEYGGFGWYITDSEASIIENMEKYTKDIINSGLFCGYCYTQLYDVGTEINGLLKFDRQYKIEKDQVKAINEIKFGK